MNPYTYRGEGEDLLHPVSQEVAARRHHHAVDPPPARVLGPPAPAPGHDLQVGEGVLVAQGLVLLQDILGLRARVGNVVSALHDNEIIV